MNSRIDDPVLKDLLIHEVLPNLSMTALAKFGATSRYHFGLFNKVRICDEFLTIEDMRFVKKLIDDTSVIQHKLTKLGRRKKANADNPDEIDELKMRISSKLAVLADFLRDKPIFFKHYINWVNANRKDPGTFKRVVEQVGMTSLDVSQKLSFVMMAVPVVYMNVLFPGMVNQVFNQYVLRQQILIEEIENKNARDEYVDEHGGSSNQLMRNYISKNRF